ncbi:MAG: hypothetical protein ACKPFB_12420 [Planktothrix sp.]
MTESLLDFQMTESLLDFQMIESLLDFQMIESLLGFQMTESLLDFQMTENPIGFQMNNLINIGKIIKKEINLLLILNLNNRQQNSHTNTWRNVNLKNTNIPYPILKEVNA